MILNRILIWIIVVIVSLALVVLVNYILGKKTFFSSKTCNSIAFVLFLGLILMFRLNVKTVYIIKDKTNYAGYFLIGSKNYQFKNGTKKEIGGDFDWCVINDYDKTLDLQSVHYGSQWESTKANYPELSIEPYSTVIILSGIDYFLDETPPGSNKAQTNYWLRERL